jgi:hypothetical protein
MLRLQAGRGNECRYRSAPDVAKTSRSAVALKKPQFVWSVQTLGQERCDSGVPTATALRVLRFCNCDYCHGASGTALRRERCKRGVITATALAK